MVVVVAAGKAGTRSKPKRGSAKGLRGCCAAAFSLRRCLFFSKPSVNLTVNTAPKKRKHLKTEAKICLEEVQTIGYSNFSFHFLGDIRRS